MLFNNKKNGNNFTAFINHAHSSYSVENMGFLNDFVKCYATLERFNRKIADYFYRKTGEKLDYERVGWTPPVSPKQLYSSEMKCIKKEGFGNFIISLTDHDTVDGSLQLAKSYNNAWVGEELSLTFQPSGKLFHVNILGIPLKKANRIHSVLQKKKGNSDKVFSYLGDKDLIVVINHPYLDGHRKKLPRGILEKFISEYYDDVDALEINALRPHLENFFVKQLSKKTGLPLVAGGDRHALSPSAAFTMTKAATPIEFKEELKQRKTKIHYTRDYYTPYAYKIVRGFFEMIRDDYRRVSYFDMKPVLDYLDDYLDTKLLYDKISFLARKMLFFGRRTEWMYRLVMRKSTI